MYMNTDTPEYFSHFEALDHAVNAKFDSAVEQLTELVAIPSIAWEAFDLSQVHKSAEKVASLAQHVGFDCFLWGKSR